MACSNKDSPYYLSQRREELPSFLNLDLMSAKWIRQQGNLIWLAEQQQKAQDAWVQCWVVISCAESTGALVLWINSWVWILQAVLTAGDESRAEFGPGQTRLPADPAAWRLFMKGELAQAGIYKVLCKISPLAQLADVLGSWQAPSGCPCHRPALGSGRGWGASLLQSWSTIELWSLTNSKQNYLLHSFNSKIPKQTLSAHLSFIWDLILQVPTSFLTCLILFILPIPHSPKGECCWAQLPCVAVLICKTSKWVGCPDFCSWGLGFSENISSKNPNITTPNSFLGVILGE